MGDAIIALLPLYAMAFYFYGPRSLVLGLISLGSCLAADMAGGILSGRGLNPRAYSSIVTGMIIPMLLPVTIGYRIVVTAALFAVLVDKYPFGGAGNNVFNPAAAGVAFPRGGRGAGVLRGRVRGTLRAGGFGGERGFRAGA